MRKQKIYIETTLFNFYFDTDREAHADTVTLFEECAAGKFEAFTSFYVIYELENAPKEKRDKMIALIKKYNIKVLPVSDEADNLAMRYIAEGALPGGSLADASHIAVASANALDMIISLNFRHIVKEKTIRLTGAINILLGYKAIEINSPMEVIDDEKTRYHLGRDTQDTP
ncbi:MAG: PIN domain-containing protein, partial [Oscillospiraceae bacterium]|nr:PIN domain-containing protein [Oscillospiraceae bacterium]